MDFALSKEHELLQKLYREFAENEVKPLAQEIDEEERFPRETVEKLAKYGLLGIAYPVEYGGQGADYLAYIMCCEEMGKVCATTATIIGAHSTLCVYPIFTFGTEEQKQKYLPDLLSGRKLGAFALTEPGAGSDSSMQQTKAVKEGDHYILNGTKCFITNAGEADVYVVSTMTDKSKGNHGITTFIIDKDTPGFSFGKHEKKMGIRGSATADLIFENAIVPAENVIGTEGQGFKIMMKTLDAGRISMGALALGIGEGAFDITVKYVKERKQFGKHIAAFQNTKFELADIKTKLDAAQLICYKAACEKDAGRPYGLYAAECKYLCAATASDVTRRCLQLFGGYGYMREYDIERMMRDAKITEIYEGTSEVQKIVMSNHLNIR
ncbi:MAG: acyl-CoA dehydrogenase [Clostridia bacterium]|nr:acyl-CoA dehydrogenase [Clostridia bacterium]MCI1960012.1 acyl-CoA dehydrogenase [Clostridia bacterium]MCI1998994.1 acyl-CoA dehydrogenase [Clostridia bacterium]MCI2013744.1 acyl-CoA dehydrogenase [Clostridia bacterium]